MTVFLRGVTSRFVDKCVVLTCASERVNPHCHKSSTIFPATTGGANAMAKQQGVRFLGSLPLDPMIARSCDEGKNFIEECAGSPAVEAFLDIVKQIEDFCVQGNMRKEDETGEREMDTS